VAHLCQSSKVPFAFQPLIAQAAAMAYWIFKCNPAKYRLEHRLADPNPTLTWRVSRYSDEIGPGDTAFIWITGSQVLRAVMRIDYKPTPMFEFESEQAYYSDRDFEKQVRVFGTLTHRKVNLSKNALRQIPDLKDLSLFHGFQTWTNFRVTDAEGEIIMRLIREAAKTS
jgi:hypothetical protein